MNEKLFWLGFSVFPGIGPAKFKLLLEHFGDAKSAWNANADDLKKAGIGKIVVDNLVDFRKSYSLTDYYEKLKKAKVKFFTLSDPEYPKLLSQIKNPPFVLYVKGDLDFKILAKQTPIAIVGTRKITPYGSHVTRLLTDDLVRSGCVIISGLAIGVDSCAHQVTIENGGKTVAVLGSGVDYCTPAENISLYEKILDSGGAIVSEYPLGQGPTQGSFPSRNRIIAGLSVAVVVTEGAADSGALITANDAFENQRKVFAIPGPITSSYSKGPNSLLVKGATPVTCAGDILQALSLKQQRKIKNIATDNKDEQLIIDLLQNDNQHIDELIKKIGIPAAKIGTILSIMEMKGLIRNCGSGIFSLCEIS